MLNAYTKAINKRYKRSGSLFQENLKRIKIEDESYLINLIVYVNTNPLHHSIEDYKTYKYSSYLALRIKQKTKVKRDEVINLFENFVNFKHILETKKINIELLESTDK